RAVNFSSPMSCRTLPDRRLGEPPTGGSDSTFHRRENDYRIEPIQDVDDRFFIQSKCDPLADPLRAPLLVKTLTLLVARQHADTEDGPRSARGFGPREGESLRAKPVSTRLPQQIESGQLTIGSGYRGHISDDPRHAPTSSRELEMIQVMEPGS